MHFDGEISQHFSNFATIFETITTNDYPDEQKDEMIELLNAQTVEKHLTLIRTFQNTGANSSDDLSDIVWSVVQNRGKGKFGCQELFLKLFDSALDDYEAFKVKSRNMFIPQNSPVKLYETRADENLSRKVDNLTDENKVLKEELEEKIALLDKMAHVERQFINLKSEFVKIQEKYELVNTENNMLKVQLKDVTDAHTTKEAEFRKRENMLVSDIKDIKEMIVDKETLLKLSEKERGFMFTDFELLSEEIVDRDLVIQSLSEVNLKGIAFETAGVNTSFKDAELNSPRKETPRCDQCSIKRRESSLYISQLNNTIPRGRGVISPSLDDSFSPMPEELEEFNQRRSKSLSDELMDVKMSVESEKTLALKEIVDRLLSLEIDLRSRRQNLEKSVKLLLKKRKPNPKIMIRYRVTKGKLFKMQFTRYKGIKLPH